MARRRFAVKAEINLVPYIDVMLVLLVIFMITAPLSPVSQLPLPRVRADAPPKAYVQVYIKHLKPQPEFILSRIDSSSEKPMGIFTNLNRLLKKIPKNSAVLLAANADSRYEDVLKILSAIKAKGWAKVGLATR